MSDPAAAPKERSLKEISIFSRLSSEVLGAFEARCQWRRYGRGEMIIHYLDDTHHVYFITGGDARVIIYSADGLPVTFRDLGPGDLFGEMAAIDGGPRCASIEATEECTVAAIPADVFRDLLRSQPDAAEAMMRHFSEQVRRLTTRVFEFSTLAVNSRIQAELLRLVRSGPAEGRAATFAPFPTHAEIASRISTHREAVTREINRLARLGLVIRQGNTLVVTDVERLAAMIEGDETWC